MHDIKPLSAHPVFIPSFLLFPRGNQVRDFPQLLVTPAAITGVAPQRPMNADKIIRQGRL